MNLFPTQVDLKFAAPAAAIAMEAGALVRGFYESGVETEYKGEADLVTEADRASERLIVERLRARFPSHGVYGEEGTRGPDGIRIPLVHRPGRWHHEFCPWIPGLLHFDGTRVSRARLSAEQEGEIVAGVIFDPTRNELFVAEKGKGAYLNGRRIQVSRTTTVAESLLATGFPSRKRHQNPNIYFYQEITMRSHGVRRAGSAALDLAYTACGRFDGYWEFNLNPWDTSAGFLMVTEAGGMLTYFDGSPFHLASREILASNGRIHGELVQIFEDLFAGRNLHPVATPQEFLNRRAAEDEKL